MLLWVLLLLQLPALQSGRALALSSATTISPSSYDRSSLTHTFQSRHLQAERALLSRGERTAAVDPSPANSSAASNAPGAAHGDAAEHLKPPEWWPEGATEPTGMPDLDAMVRASGMTTDSPFLLVGVLTSPASAERRAAVRATWQRFVTHTRTALVLVRYVMGRNAAEVRT
jgi:hypothetical protein